MTSHTDILLVGCGNLGRALLGPWLAMDDSSHFTLLETEPSIELFDLVEPHGHRVAINPTSAFKAAVAVLAVKPQVMDASLKTLGQALPHNSLVISVAAGKRIATLTQFLHADQPIVRAMPNMAASVGEAISVCIANKNVTPQQRALATELLECIGKVLWVEDENLLDAVTAASGSGIAYVFLLAEALAQAAAKVGLPPELAAKLARQVIVGAGVLLKDTNLTPEDLRQRVTSKGGTTEAAMQVLLSENGMHQLVTSAMEVATARAKQLAD
jgi:pyrroline-5-carboxylate reductase